MEPWEVMISESQERMIAIVRPQMLEAVEAVLDRWELEHAVDRRGDRDRRAARLLGRRGRRRDPGAAPDGRVPALRGRAGAPCRDAAREIVERAARRGGARRAARLAGAPQPRVRLPPLRPARRIADGSPARASTPPCCGCGRRCAGSPSRSTGRAGSRGSIRSRAARSRCSRPHATSRASAGSRSASPTASTSGTRRSPRSGGSSPQAIDGIAAACEALDVPVVSGNVSLYNETNGRAIHPTPVVGAVGLVEDVRRVPTGWREATSLFAAFASPRLARGLRVPGALRRGERHAGAARPRGGGAARLVPLARRPARDARPRRVGGRARGVPRRGRRLLRLRRRARSP